MINSSRCGGVVIKSKGWDTQLLDKKKIWEKRGYWEERIK